MSDVVFVAIILAFFAFAVLFIRICDWLIGSDEEAMGQPDVEPSVTQVAA